MSSVLDTVQGRMNEMCKSSALRQQILIQNSWGSNSSSYLFEIYLWSSNPNPVTDAICPRQPKSLGPKSCTVGFGPNPTVSTRY